MNIYGNPIIENIQDGGVINGNIEIKGDTTMEGDLDLTNNDILNAGTINYTTLNPAPTPSSNVVVGTPSDNEIARFDTDGNTLQGSSITISDTADISGVGGLSINNVFPFPPPAPSAGNLGLFNINETLFTQRSTGPPSIRSVAYGSGYDNLRFMRTNVDGVLEPSTVLLSDESKGSEKGITLTGTTPELKLESTTGSSCSIRFRNTNGGALQNRIIGTMTSPTTGLLSFDAGGSLGLLITESLFDVRLPIKSTASPSNQFEMNTDGSTNTIFFTNPNGFNSIESVISTPGAGLLNFKVSAGTRMTINGNSTELWGPVIPLNPVTSPDIGTFTDQWNDLWLSGIAHTNEISGAFAADEVKISNSNQTLLLGTTTRFTSNNPIEISTSGTTQGLVNFGRFSQTANLTVSTGGSQSIFGTGVGSKLFAANTAYVGASGCFKLGGTYTCANNNQLSFQIYGGSPSTTLLFDSGAIVSQGAASAKFWETEIEYTVRAIGGAGVALIQVNGNFNFVTDGGGFEGGSIVGTTNASLDLTIDNILDLRVNLLDSATQSITSTVGVLHKLY
jgi:hypothetical protein